MIRLLASFSALFIGIAAQAQTYPNNTPRGQYIRPDYQNPVPTPTIQPVDVCQSQLYQGLVGRPEGTIYIPGLPGAKRVLKPAFDDRNNPMPGETPLLLEVRDYLPGQTLYAPSIRSSRDLLATNQYQTDRLTIELNQDGLVQEIRCG